METRALAMAPIARVRHPIDVIWHESGWIWHLIDAIRHIFGCVWHITARGSPVTGAEVA
jgi:hypothetical protein